MGGKSLGGSRGSERTMRSVKIALEQEGASLRRYNNNNDNDDDNNNNNNNNNKSN